MPCSFLRACADMIRGLKLDCRTQKFIVIGVVFCPNFIFGIVISPLKVSCVWLQE